MDNDSISSELQELFDLFKSGALSKEEYDQLKSQILGAGKSQKTETVAKEIQSASVKEPIIEPLPTEESAPEPLSKNVDDSKMQSSKNKTEESDLKIDSKSRVKRIVMITIPLILIIVGTIYTLNNKMNVPAKNQNQELESIHESNPSIVEPSAQKHNSIWDEASAKKSIMDELSIFNNWSNTLSGDTTQISHIVSGFSKVNIDTEDLMVGLVFSDNGENDCNACAGGVLSIFEFRDHNGWKLEKKAIAFMNNKSIDNPPNNIGIYRISPDNYGVLVNYTISGGSFGGVSEKLKTLYGFIDNDFKPMLYGGEEKIAFIIKTDGFYDIEVTENNTEVKTIYKFNGNEYVK